jgi:hypothetical protein
LDREEKEGNKGIITNVMKSLPEHWKRNLGWAIDEHGKWSKDTGLYQLGIGRMVPQKRRVVTSQ